MGSLRQLLFSNLLLVVVAGKFHRSLAICVMSYHALDLGNNDDLLNNVSALVY